MTNRKQRREKKQKARKEKAKQRVVEKRKELRAELKQIREDHKFREHFRVKPMPFRKDAQPVFNKPGETVATNAGDAQRKEWVKKKLEHNMKILEVLEAEMAEEDRVREETRKALEAQGATTLKDQLNLIGAMSEREVALNQPKVIRKKKDNLQGTSNAKLIVKDTQKDKDK